MTSISGPRRRTDIRFEHMPDGSAVLFDPTNAMTYAITASAALVWEACDGSASPGAIEARLADTYDAPRDVIARDVDALLKHFGELGLLQPGCGSSE
jgi:hypothetical protein